MRSEHEEPPRKAVSDIRALRALAHPDRVAILQLLMAGGARTATECAHAVGASPSACSYHLRELERFGFVVRDESEAGDRRTRPWKAAAIGFSLGRRLSEEPAAGRAMFAALREADRLENDRMARLFVEHADELPPEWQDAASFATFELALTPTELRQLTTAVDRLLRPYRVGARSSRPDDADPAVRPVHVVVQAFPRMDAR
jgi:DNA-binding transcriptional ArsR family regulator